MIDRVIYGKDFFLGGGEPIWFMIQLLDSDLIHKGQEETVMIWPGASDSLWCRFGRV